MRSGFKCDLVFFFAISFRVFVRRECGGVAPHGPGAQVWAWGLAEDGQLGDREELRHGEACTAPKQARGRRSEHGVNSNASDLVRATVAFLVGARARANLSSALNQQRWDSGPRK